MKSLLRVPCILAAVLFGAAMFFSCNKPELGSNPGPDPDQGSTVNPPDPSLELTLSVENLTLYFAAIPLGPVVLTPGVDIYGFVGADGKIGLSSSVSTVLHTSSELHYDEINGLSGETKTMADALWENPVTTQTIQARIDGLEAGKVYRATVCWEMGNNHIPFYGGYDLLALDNNTLHAVRGILSDIEACAGGEYEEGVCKWCGSAKE